MLARSMSLAVLLAAATFASAAHAPMAEGKLTPSHSNITHMGKSVAIEGETALVGTGFHGAYVFERAGGGWSREALLNIGAHDGRLGQAVDLSGPWAFVADSVADTAAVDGGAVETFHRGANGWSHHATLTASDAAADDEFGSALSVDGGWAAVALTTWADADDNGRRAVYLFRFDGTSWVESQRLLPPTVEDTQFGKDVDLRGGRLIVGSPRETGVVGGSAYVYKEEAGSWVEEAHLVATDRFAYPSVGWSVSIDDDRAILGAPLGFYGGERSGIAYLFSRDGSAWSQVQKVGPEDPDFGYAFGWSVDIMGRTAVVGSYREGSGERGAAYVFTDVGPEWRPVSRLEATDPQGGMEFGHSVAIDDRRVIVGTLHQPGAAYVYDWDTDEDGLADDDEVDRYGTDPGLKDTDGDCQEDGDEVVQGSDPLDPRSVAVAGVVVTLPTDAPAAACPVVGVAGLHDVPPTLPWLP